jgi:uncharacterized protein (TIGR02646 family)
MRHLDRSAVAAPACLAHLKPGDPWKDPPVDKGQIRAHLTQLQRERCAYCECDLSREGARSHIEHFEQQARAPAKRFYWSNLFLSCTHEDKGDRRCGKHKDHVANSYAPPDILKPDVDEPREYLAFDEDGAVYPREGIGRTKAHRARTTIRVFALNERKLVRARASYLVEPARAAKELVALGIEPGEARAYAELTAQDFADLPFTSAILDVLGL